MNKNELLKQIVEGCQGPEKCCVVARNDGGGATEIVIAGDNVTALTGIMFVIDRLSEITGIPFEAILSHIAELHELAQSGGGPRGYKN